MSVHRSTHYEEYREFFSLLASGDPAQYNRAQNLIPPTHISTSSRRRVRPIRMEIETLSDSADESDDSSTTAVEVENIDECKGYIKTVELVVEEVASVAPLPISEDISGAPLVTSVPPFTYQSYATKQESESPLADLESSASAVTTSSDEFRAKVKMLLRGLYDIETFRALVHDVLRDSEKTFRPLTEVEARRAQAPAKGDTNKANDSPIFKGFDDDKANHATKKRCVVQLSNLKVGGVESDGSDGKAGFKRAQQLMDMLSDLMTQYKGSSNPHWKKFKVNLGGSTKNLLKLKSSKKRVFTDLDD